MYLIDAPFRLLTKASCCSLYVNIDLLRTNTHNTRRPQMKGNRGTTRQNLPHLLLISELAGEKVIIPNAIKLKRGKVIIGRGSPNVSVDVTMSIRSTIHNTPKFPAYLTAY